MTILQYVARLVVDLIAFTLISFWKLCGLIGDIVLHFMSLHYFGFHPGSLGRQHVSGTILCVCSTPQNDVII